MPTIYERFDSLLRPRGHFFYGWYIVGAAGGVQFLSAFLWMQSYGVYVVLLQQEFGWSKTLVAIAFRSHPDRERYPWAASGVAG